MCVTVDDIHNFSILTVRQVDMKFFTHPYLLIIDFANINKKTHQKPRRMSQNIKWMILRGVVANVPGYNKTVNEFELQSRYKVHFRTLEVAWTPLSLPTMDYIVPLLSFYKCNIMAEGFRFMPLGLVGLGTFRLSAWVSWVQT